MAGGVIMVVVLVVVLPVVILMSMAPLAAVLGWMVNDEVDQLNEGHELLELSRRESFSPPAPAAPPPAPPQ